MSALNYEFLVQRTRMEGKNSYCFVKCVIKCVINEQYNRWSLSRGTQREYSSKPLEHSIVKRILVFER